MLLVGDQGKLANDDDDDEDREEKSVNFRRDSAGPSLQENERSLWSSRPRVCVDLLKVCKRFDHGLGVERVVERVEGCFTRVDIAVVHGQRRRRLDQIFRAGTRVVIHVVLARGGREEEEDEEKSTTS